jgi:hypothetical protein
VKLLAEPLASVLLARHGLGDPAWIHHIPVPDDDAFPVLVLPADRLRYSTDRSYPIALEPRVIARPMLVVHVASFDSAAHAAADPDWAIPAAYTPRNDDERIRQALGFDEGWEDAEPECMFACDARFAGFWRGAAERGRFGLTVAGAKSLYPVAVHAREMEPIDAFLRAVAQPVSTRSPRVPRPGAAKPSKRSPSTRPRARKK